MRTRLPIVVLLLGAVLGCSRNGTPPEPPRQLPYRICIGGILAPLPLVADYRGFFQAEGLTPEIRILGDGSTAMKELIAGRCDACLVGEFPVVRQSFDRNDLVIIATLASSDNAVKILARRDRGIAKPEDLAGKRVGMSRGTISSFFLDQFLRKNRINPENLTLVDIAHHEIGEALKRGDIDAFAGSSVAYIRGKTLIGEQGITFTEPGLTSHAACLTVKREWLARNRQIARQTLQALLKAEQELERQPETLTSVLSDRLNMPVKELKNVMADQHNRVTIQQVLVLSMEDEARWMKETGMANGNPRHNYLNLIDPTILREIRPEAVSLR
jgi:NitT/TauT family transport system substrate-binding protein